MDNKIIPQKLKEGDGVRIISPSRSLALPWIDEELKKIAIQRFKEIGLNLSFSKNVNKMDQFDSSPIKDRISDIEEAFKDKSIKLIITSIGGFNSNQLLSHLDYNLIKENPKIICGHSDITSILVGIYKKTNMITYSGPQFYLFGDKRGFDYTLEYFKKCLMSEKPFEVKPSKKWSDERWANDQENRNFKKNDGPFFINEGEAEGEIIGGNQHSLQLLQGTEYWPDLAGKILFLEDSSFLGRFTLQEFDRNLQSIIHQSNFDKVKGIVIGRFQTVGDMTKEKIKRIIKSKKELNSIPVIANADFGHTTPMITFPIGGTAKITSNKGKPCIKIISH